MRRTLLCLAMLAAASAPSSSVMACDNSPDLARIPGSSDAEAERRYLAYENDIGIIARLQGEQAALENSWTVYLATIATVDGGEAGRPPKGIGVVPVWQVRGQLPTGRQQITFPETNVVCRARGYLPLNHVERGRLIVVFEAPGSRYGVDAEVVRSGELIDAITMYALKVDPSQFR